MAELAAAPDGELRTTEQIATAQGIPTNFLLAILRQLRNARLVRRVAGGGYELARPGSDVSLADVIRVVDGPLASVRDERPSALAYDGAAESLRTVWLAVRGGLREVLEKVTVADLAAGRLPANVHKLAQRHEDDRL